MGSLWWQRLRWAIEGVIYPLHCRLFGHVWHGVPGGWIGGGDYQDATSYCEYCGIEQTED